MFWIQSIAHCTCSLLVLLTISHKEIIHKIFFSCSAARSLQLWTPCWSLAASLTSFLSFLVWLLFCFLALSIEQLQESKYMDFWPFLISLIQYMTSLCWRVHALVVTDWQQQQRLCVANNGNNVSLLLLLWGAGSVAPVCSVRVKSGMAVTHLHLCGLIAQVALRNHNDNGSIWSSLDLDLTGKIFGCEKYSKRQERRSSR